MPEPVSLTLAALAATSIGGAVVLADQAAPWPEWAALPANLVAVALLLYVVMTGRWRRREDCAEEATHAVELSDALVAGKSAELEAVKARLEAVVRDRDAWREAHAQEVQARVEAERAGRELLDGQSVTVRLLSALESVLAGRAQQ